MIDQNMARAMSFDVVVIKMYLSLKAMFEAYLKNRKLSITHSIKKLVFLLLKKLKNLNMYDKLTTYKYKFKTFIIYKISDF